MISVKTHSNTYSDYTRHVQIVLYKNNLLDINDINGYYDLKTEKAFKKYQKLIGKSQTGIVEDGDISFENSLVYVPDNSGVYSNSINTYELKTDNEIKSDLEKENQIKENNYHRYKTQSKDRNPFFSDNKEDILRKGNLDIEINYSNSLKQKRTIEGVKIRSISQVIDANGDVIADVYSFVARDLIENNK